MQEDINDKAVRLAVTLNKITAKGLKKAIDKILKELEQMKKQVSDKTKKPPEPKRGKQTLKQLSKQGDGLSTVELTDPNLRLLYREMKRHNVDFSAVKDGKGKYTLFFKGKDADSVTHAFKRYTAKSVQRANTKTPIQSILAAAKAAAQKLANQLGKVKNKNRGAR
jgi:DNA-directed RNA polymerase subunit L